MFHINAVFLDLFLDWLFRMYFHLIDVWFICPYDKEDFHDLLCISIYLKSYIVVSNPVFLSFELSKINVPLLFS